ncbi:kynurenine 3-monooxygenase [Prorops nasuta]|uniref:kynurenine 3-monooxygenase n=1 Tax=Prorops nasuta TaxID=863751 RepID=UPI0034CD9F32
MESVEGKPRIAIIGGGLVGALAACYFGKRNYPVCIYEYRSDIRKEDSRGQSIDLALSRRGREALRGVGLEDAIINHHGIPMRGRMLHGRDGSLKEIIYDPVHKNCIYSVNRRHLNVVLLNAAEKYSTVDFRFNVKLIDANLEEGKMKFLNTKTQGIEEESADLIIGADGAYSTIRKIMLKRPLFNCSQTYIEHGYVELFVPSRLDGKFAMSGNHLHIWPRGEFMMIALPNDDGTFTGNIFAPFSTFEKIKTPQDLLNFYDYQFPDLISLIGEKKLIKDFFKREPKTLISVKCKPYHLGNKVLLVGDAAHAMVPFYAQGMNTGFEDILILDELMTEFNSDFSKVLSKFTERRSDDAHAICDLAMYNYLEMRDLVTRRSFLVRKNLDTFLNKFFPKSWIPLYATVHFSRMNFRQCISNKEWQDKTIQKCLCYFGLIVFTIISTLLFTKFA